jgi:putative adhesin
MKRPRTNIQLLAGRGNPTRARAAVYLFLGASLILASAASVIAQQRMTRRYPAGKQVRLELRNLSGTITVETWDRDEIKLTATLESPSARLTPRQTDTGVSVDVVGDNRGRSDVGDVNFNISVPASSSVDLETKRGNITVSNIHGGMVRAHVSSEGDIILTGISAARVFASNTMGDIFFDGRFASNGEYEFKSNQGNITLRIPADSAFSLVAWTPTKQLAMGPFWNASMKSVGDGRKVTGDVGNAQARVSITNFRGNISFRQREAK